jgi:NAD-dependent dihydropyrimidine dehydrogenase PreA subunit
MPYFIGPACIDVLDRSCVQQCPVDCIYEGARKLYINPAECIDCGACEPVCPEAAIIADWQASPAESAFEADDARFFTVILPGRDAPIGDPGGSEGLGAVGADTALVHSWQRRG